jgi:hypothetical protein
VPIPHDNVAFIRFERQGPLPDNYRGSEESADFSAPLGELEAFVALLAGLVAQARRDQLLSDSAYNDQR